MELEKKLLFEQIINGCDDPKCKNDYCLCNSNRKAFQVLENQIVIPDDIKLCDWFPIDILSSDIETNLDFINKICGEHGQLGEDLLLLLSNVQVFGLLLKPKGSRISTKNSCINDMDFLDFSTRFCLETVSTSDFSALMNSIVQSIIQKDNVITYTVLRSMLIIFYFPNIMLDSLFETTLIPFIRYFASLDLKHKGICIKWLSNLRQLRIQMLGILHYSMSHIIDLIPNIDIHSSVLIHIVALVKIVYVANHFSCDPLPSYYFYNKHIESRISPEQELVFFESKDRFSYLQSPFLIPLKTKSKFFEIESQSLMEMIAITSMVYEIVQGNSPELFFQIKVNRNTLFQDAFDQIMNADECSVLKKLKVTFIGESALDIGGPSREFIYLIIEQLFDPEMGLFNRTKNNQFWFNHNCSGKDHYFHFVGEIVGLAVYNHITIPIRFPMLLYKMLVSHDNPILSDLAEIEPEVAKSFSFLIDMLIKKEDISSLDLYFEVSREQNGTNVMIPLTTKYANQLVDNNNVEIYINSYFNWITKDSIKTQFEEFKKGFYYICRAKMFRNLEPDELDIYVSGEMVYDWGSFQRSSTYENGYHTSSQAVIWFWEIFFSFSETKKLKFLKFSTGTDRAPLGGLKNVKLRLQRVGDSECLPVSHTCFNILTLPDYVSRDKMSKKIEQAIEYTEGFGII